MEPIFIAGLISLTIATSATALFSFLLPPKDQYGRRYMTQDEEDNLETVAVVCGLGWVTTFLMLLISLFISTG